jgi:hypothetical protein
MRVAGVTSTTISALGPNHGGPSGDGRALIVAPVGKSSGNAVETQGNTPDGISNDRTIRRLQPHGQCLDWEKPGRSAQPVAVIRRHQRSGERNMAMNMSYCRFENTLAALRECDEAMAESVNPLGELSESERKAAKRLLKLCREMADNYGDDE